MQTAASTAQSDLEDDGSIPVAFGVMAEGLGFLLKVGQLTAAESNNRHFREADIAPSVFTILKFLQTNPGLRQGHLAQALKIKPAMMTKLIRDFEEQGWVDRVIPDDDRRTVILRLTEAGDARLRAADSYFEDAKVAEFGPLTRDEVNELRRLLQRYIGLGPDAILRLPG
jgi:DNA-binding MarR family transcriptional regulator